MTVPNLRELYGHRYRISHDQAANDRHDPWMFQIPCGGRGVTISPHGEGMLAVECDNRPGVAKRLSALGLRLHQDGDRERTFLCPLDRFDEVAAVVRPRRRRVLDEPQQTRLLAAGTGH